MSGATELAIIFIHIPKAAGTTLHEILERQYPKSSIYNIDTSNQKASIENFKQLPNVEKSQIRILKGHMPYGLHEYLQRSATYITMLRDPVERVISHYNYAESTPGHYLHKYIVNEGMDLKAYVGSGVSHEMDNGQVRLLSGHDDDLPYGSCNEDHLEKAKRNLDAYFSVVGLVERFDESVLLMREMLGWRKLPLYVRMKVGKRMQGAEPVPSEVREYIHKINYLDDELYRYATRLFDERLAERMDKSASALSQFHWKNSAYGVVGRPVIGLRALAKKVVRG